MSKPISSSLDITAILRGRKRIHRRKPSNGSCPVVYDELRRQAHNYLRRERSHHTLQTTALIHEAYIKLVEQENVSWNDRSHFFAVSARIMRQILVDYAKTKHRLKRGAFAEHVPLDETVQQAGGERGIDLIALDEALERLGKLDPQQACVVEMRYFAGMSIPGDS
jgi:RNA polymerase sigma factor (TIGR02999 family)